MPDYNPKDVEDVSWSLHNLKNRFYTDFSALCNKALKDAKVIAGQLTNAEQEQLISEFEMQLGETANFYSRNDDA
jgi:hypothetical protein